MLFAILSGFFAACMLLPAGKFIKERLRYLLSLLPLSLFMYFASYIPQVMNGNVVLESTEWIPSLGVNASFRLDGLSLLFTLLITGIGFLVFLYSASYLKGHNYLDRFYAYLCLFMSAMLGMVLSDNILLLFVFWELTSISSFFLIGFNNDSKESRKSALTALSVTGLGGFFLMAGIIIISHITGTYSMQELLGSPEIKDHALYPLVLVLIFIGAFTKSAQFPFHFWLPGAMKAPTPVSAYLHSATMVKAGIFLLARFSPILGGTTEWSYTLMGIGGFTMLYAAVHSLFRTDLKAVLAYSTISALGIMVFLIGIGTKEAFIALATFIVVHALYKAALFLITGIIDHEAGTRDITKLAGLKKVLLPVYIAGVLAALSSAGLPLTFGFIGKDLIYEATLNTASFIAIYLTILAVATNFCLVAAGFMAGIKPFTGKLPQEFSAIRLPHAAMWLPPLFLGIVGFVFGCFPAVIGDAVISPAVNSIAGNSVELQLKIWHGFNLVLILSIATLALGSIIYYVNRPSAGKFSFIANYHKVSPQYAYDWLAKKFYSLSEWYTGIMHNGFLRSYILKIIIFAQLLFIYELLQGGPIYLDYSRLSPISVYEGATVLFLIAGLYVTLTTSSRLTAVIGTSVTGYALCLLFLYFSAPDLAITQFTIDTLTVVLFVLVLFNLPPFIKFPGVNKPIIIRDTLVSLSFGLIMAIVAIKVLQVPTDIESSDFYGTYAYTLAKGKNVVNVILVDFRGFDTMFEIVVLAIAALGVYSLLKLRLKSSEKE
ncbi:putative monovalent cation/H+ antiporter subunit A [Flavobacterium sp.]|uniref:putative monovalent cation/H+ antiporter subunit A n=1 Tax=Flavobacterium sp. TaxID=239 RepID=UPI004034A01D